MRLLARPLLPALAALAVLAALAPAAPAAPPSNDWPTGAAPFEPYETKAGPAGERQALADLAEATPEADITGCLGTGSFARTVWYRIDATGWAREVTIEASGRTTDPVDLAVFVQAGGSETPPLTRMVNACAGPGVGGADAAEDRTTAVTFRVPPGRSILVQVGRRGGVRSVEDDQVQLHLAAAEVSSTAPRGDQAGSATPTVRKSGREIVGLSGATTTEEDPAIARCPARASVWRRVRPRKTGRYTFVVEGRDAGTLTVFRGSPPAPRGFVDCVDREGPGPLVLTMQAKRRQRLWVRVGTDRPDIGATSVLLVRRWLRGDRASGGGCLGNPDSTISGGLSQGPAIAKARNRSRYLGVLLAVRKGPVCAARLELMGPKGRRYASAEVGAIRGGEVVLLRRSRKLVRGRYRVKAEGASYAGVRLAVPSTASFRLR